MHTQSDESSDSLIVYALLKNEAWAMMLAATGAFAKFEAEILAIAGSLQIAEET